MRLIIVTAPIKIILIFPSRRDRIRFQDQPIRWKENSKEEIKWYFKRGKIDELNLKKKKN